MVRRWSRAPACRAWIGDVPGGPPVMSHTAFGDAVGGLNGCAAVLTALIHAKLTGAGASSSISRQIECMMPFAAPWIVAHSIDGKPAGEARQPPSGSSCRMAASAVPARTTGSWSRFPTTRCGRNSHGCSAARTGRRTKTLSDGRRPSHASRPRSRPRVTTWTSDARALTMRWPRCKPPVLRRAWRGCRSISSKDPQLHARGFIQTGRPRLHRPASAAVDAVPRGREAVCDPLGAADAWRAQPRDPRRHARPVRGRARRSLRSENIIGTEMLMEEQLVKEKKRAAG